MGCPNDILFGYTYFGESIITVGPITLVPTGTYGGKDSYTWFDATLLLDLIIRWDIVNNRWEFGYDDGGFNLIAFLNYIPTDCPVDPNEAFNWTTVLRNWTEVNSAYGPEIKPSLTPEQECFPLLVWNKQCEFSKCVYNYVQLLQFGAAPCDALDELMNKRRALEILNCYDVRDIPDNTTDYNVLTYAQIKKLLN
jgi:hypothetical protein